ncbi:hypothetical protein Tco_1250163 [Tanacetum coccineum]
MADLEFVDQHNMVACLERTNENAEFHQIATAKSKTINNVKQIHATLDGKTVVISESSVRSDLYFNDEDGITCLSNDEIFVNLTLMSSKTTAWNEFSTNLASAVICLGEDDRVVRAATTTTSLEAEQKSGNIHKTESTATLNEPSPQETSSGSGPRCQDTTLGDADAQTMFETASKQSRDPPLSEVNTSRSGEDSMEHQDDLTDFVPPTPHDSPLSGVHTPGSDGGMKLFKIGTSKRKSLDKKNVSKHGKNLKTRPMFEEGDFDDDIDDMVNKAIENVEGDTINAIGAVNTATTRVSAASASVTNAGIKSEKSKEKRFAFKDVEESARSTTILPTIDPKDKGKGIMKESEKPLKNPIKAQIQMDEELAMRLHEEEKAELERMQRDRAAQKKASNAALTAEFDDVQARIDADALLAARLQEEEREQFSFDEQARFLVETIVERKRFFAAQRAE